MRRQKRPIREATNAIKGRPAEFLTFALALSQVITDVLDGGKFHSARTVQLLVLGSTAWGVSMIHDHVWPWIKRRLET